MRSEPRVCSYYVLNILAIFRLKVLFTVLKKGSLHKINQSIKLYLRYHFIKNALPVSRLHNKF